ncbi:wHTH domain-containing protein [Streptomyces hesseae]|uniref:ATP-binding protein n=1 Tax=Streptomyces hesseae TaxID=3075519 RepID=A0ABU2SWI3_9ACTN|nr:ATP-binding protein [Streptomyces sp. DSM 40473]MDT0453205.1 ATP-binding protein [Streptomyces sp. DSM 40473]
MGQNIHIGGSACPSTSAVDGWVDLAVRSTVWRHIPADRDVAFFRERVAETVAALARLRDEAERESAADDPWRDDGVVPRFAESVEWLLGEPGPERRLDLYPAEAALLVLMPFVHRVQSLRLTAALRALVDPTRLDRQPGPGHERASFEVFAEGHDLLVKRALQHPEAAEPIGWWLFHRWLALREEFSDAATVRTLWETVGDPAAALGETLEPRRICRLLHGLRRGPDVCNREYLDELPADDAAGVRGGGPQRIRDQRLALLLTLAHGASREITALPQIVVEHLGIPHPVDLDQLRRTLERSRWGGSHDLPVLHAECHHEAVIEGLRAYTDRTDGLLAAVRRTARERVTHSLPALPARLSADGVTPAEGAFTGWASFRLDERRVRDLLMGVQLYRDRDLAVRELYQNALDACRYRRARTQYLDRTRDATYTYDGRIAFEQGEDGDGREYVECRDNGVGMGESELRGVFSQAGSRFVDQLDFKLERAGWAETVPPVELFPNSRFGIGVLSYFMLADEIRVTTCRMDAKGRLGPLLRVSIFGPGHLFRIERLAECGEEAGTQIRLYLRGVDERWSCLTALERVLGIAEFPTEARHGDRCSTWDADRLTARRAPDQERFGLNVHGTLVEWAEAPDGVQVFWCERGGGLFVDGLVVQPETRRGVLTARTHSGLAGVVVNLSGAHAPGRLSVDRSRILDDVSGQVADLLAAALKSLLTSDEPLPRYEWICRLADSSACLADLVTKAAVEAGRVLEYEGHRIDMATAGCLPADMKVLPVGTFGTHDRRDTLRDLPWTNTIGDPPDHILLWRIIAHGPNAALTALEEVCPEIQDVRVRPALPSDDLLLSRRGDAHYRLWNIRAMGYSKLLERSVDMADTLGISWRSAARRAAELGIRTVDRPVTVAELRSAARIMGVGSEEAAVRWRDLGVPVREAVVTLATAGAHDPVVRQDLGAEGDRSGWLDPDEIVPPGHVAKASRVLDVPVPDVCARLAAYGLRYDATGLPDRPDDRTMALLSERANGKAPWRGHEQPIPPGQVLENSHDLGIPPGQLLAELAYLGFTTPSVFPADAHPDDARLLCDTSGYLRPGKGVLYRHLLQDAGRSPQEVIDRLRAYGIDIPLKFPSAPTRLDKELLTDGTLWWGLHTSELVPFAHVVRLAEMLRTEPSEVAWYLRGYGVSLARDDLPEGLTFTDALRLVKRGNLGADLRFVTVLRNFSFVQLLSVSLRVGQPLSQVATWLRELGLWSGSVADAVRETLSRVPRA